MLHDSAMIPQRPSSLVSRLLAGWNWKCALLSAAARSTVFLVATARNGLRGSLSVVLVETGYVVLTAGIYAGMQQQALGFRSRLRGDLAVVLGVPGLAQVLDWTCHRLVGAPIAGKTTMAVCGFTLVSALFHLHAMRRGAFLTGRQGRSLLNDFQWMPRLILGFVLAPFRLGSALVSQMSGGYRSEPASSEETRLAA